MREGLDLRVHAHGAEHAWRSQALHGTVGRPTKFRLMPCQGVDLVDLTLLKGVLNGRLTRLKSLDLTPQDIKLAVECELQIWALHGYPLRIILEVWQCGRYFPEAVKHARATLQHALRNCGNNTSITSN